MCHLSHDLRFVAGGVTCCRLVQTRQCEVCIGLYIQYSFSLERIECRQFYAQLLIFQWSSIHISFILPNEPASPPYLQYLESCAQYITNAGEALASTLRNSTAYCVGGLIALAGLLRWRACSYGKRSGLYHIPNTGPMFRTDGRKTAISAQTARKTINSSVISVSRRVIHQLSTSFSWQA